MNDSPRALTLKADIHRLANEGLALSKGPGRWSEKAKKVEEIEGQLRDAQFELASLKAAEANTPPGYFDMGGTEPPPNYAPRNSGPTTKSIFDTDAWSKSVLDAAKDEAGNFKSLIPSGSVVVPSLMGGIVSVADRPRSILQLVPTTQLRGTDQYSYLHETVRTHNAAPVAIGALKPTSVYSVARVDSSVKTIAHLSEPIPRQWLADAPLLDNYVRGSLVEGVALALENEVVNGDGTGQHFLGIDHESTHQQQAWSNDLFETTRKAVTKLENVQIPTGTFVFNPADWERLELQSDDDGNYQLGPGRLPVDRARRQLWGQQVVTSTVVTSGVGFLVDFPGSTQMWEREGVQVDWSQDTYDPNAISTGVGASDFQVNMQRFRAEGRWGFAVIRPAGVVEIDLTA